METRIQKWGNSLGLRIPKAFADEAGLEAGSAVELTVQDGELRVRAARTHRYELDDLLEGVTTTNRHDVVEWGESTGREAW